MSPLLGSRTAVKCVLIKGNVRLVCVLLLCGEILESDVSQGETVFTKDPTSISVIKFSYV